MKVTTLIPIRRNDGSKVSKAEFREILDGVFNRFDGYTVAGKTRGRWRDSSDGQIYQDICLKLEIVTSPERYNEAVAEVLNIGRRLGQKAMYLEVRDFEGVQFIPVD